MTASSKLLLTLTLSLALISSASVSASTAEHSPAGAQAVVEQEDVFDYSQYQSPPIWEGATNVRRAHDENVPINYRIGGARGGDIHDRRRRSMPGKKRAIIFDKDAHLFLDNEFGDLGLVNAPADTNIPPSAGLKRRALGKRASDGDEEVNDDSEDGYDVDTFEEVSIEKEEDGENDVESDEDDEDEDEDEDNYDAVDENEERRLDSEAGLLDWIEEMKSEEYFDLAGHPDGRGQDDIQEQQNRLQEQDRYEEEEEEEQIDSFDEDEPSPSEEEIFAASWHN